VAGFGFTWCKRGSRWFQAVPATELRLRLYKASEDGVTLYCVGLLVRHEDPGGWVAVWRRCYDEVEKAAELLNSIEPLARSRLGGLLATVEISLPGHAEQQAVPD
jgi:hypothetical protein